MREFRPPARSSALRVVLALALPLLLLVPIGALAMIAGGFSRATYTIASGSLVIHSGDLVAGERTVRIADLTETRVVTLQGGRRTAGTALPGFCAGRFTYPDLGTVWQVTTCNARGVLLRTTGDAQPIVISPPDPQGFIDQLRAGTAGGVTLPPPDRGPIRAVLFVSLPLAAITVLVLVVVLLLGPGRMRYLVGDGFFEVQTMFSRKRWPTAGARAKGYAPGPMMRVGGTAAPGYYTGRYREAGKWTRVAATDLKHALLFEGEARVVVSPEDRVGMLRALEEEGVAIERAAT